MAAGHLHFLPVRNRYTFDIKNGVKMHPPSLKVVKIERQFDFIWAFSVLIHMKDEILHDCLLVAQRHLKNSGVFYATVNLGERPDGHWQGFPVVYRGLKFYQDACGRHGLKAENLGQSKTFHTSGIRAQDEKNILKFTLA